MENLERLIRQFPDEFADAISQGRKPETSGEDSLKSLALIFAALDSAKSHRQVSVKNYL